MTIIQKRPCISFLNQILSCCQFHRNRKAGETEPYNQHHPLSPRELYIPITLNDLAEQFYLSPYYLCGNLKNTTNSTIVQYINSLRVGHAQRLF